MLSLMELTPPQTLVIAVASAAAQTVWHAKFRVKLVQLFFNTTCVGLAALAATWVYHKPWLEDVAAGELLRLTMAGIAYFIVPTMFRWR